MSERRMEVEENNTGRRGGEEGDKGGEKGDKGRE